MITYNGIIAYFKQFAKQHSQITSFTEGDLDQIELKKINEYPILHIYITGTSIQDQTIVYNVDTYILTATELLEENDGVKHSYREDSLGSTLLIMQDLRSEFFKGKW